jgi:hypothetical protein
MKSHTFADGRTIFSAVRLPYCVRINGRATNYGSLAAAEAAASDGAQIFFDYAPGCGRLIR